MSLFDTDFTPMLLSEIKKPFNNPNYIFELKIDGIRAMIFTDGNNLIIKNKRGIDITYRYPELDSIKNITKKKVIFDGEIALIENGVFNFEKLKERILLENKNKISYYSKSNPVIFMVFDIIYEEKDLTNLSLLKRKAILNKYIDKDNFIKSEYFLEKGKELYKFAKENNLEGIVAKKKDSIYLINKRSKDWIKIKNWIKEDFLIIGFKEEKKIAVASLLIGQKINNNFILIGSVTIGKRNPDYAVIKKVPLDKTPTIKKEGYINIVPTLNISVEYMEKTKNGKLRQPHYRGLKNR